MKNKKITNEILKFAKKENKKQARYKSLRENVKLISDYKNKQKDGVISLNYLISYFYIYRISFSKHKVILKQIWTLHYSKNNY